MPLIQYRFSVIFENWRREAIENSRLSNYLVKLDSTATELSIKFISNPDLFSCVDDVKVCEWIRIKFYDPKTDDFFHNVVYNVANPKIIPIISLDYGKSTPVLSEVIFEIKAILYKGNK